MSKKLKIGLVLDDTLDTPDGVQQHVLTVGNWLSEQGHEIHYLVGDTKRKDIKNLHILARNVKVRFNKNRLSIPLPANKKLISQKLRDLKLDIIHVQMPYSPLLAGRIINAAPENTTIIGTFHIVPANWIHSTGTRALGVLNKITLKKFDAFIAVSKAAQIFAKTSFNIESEIIPNPINLKKYLFKPTYNKRLTIIFLGRLVERKGCTYLLKALELLQKKYRNNYQVIIGGRGPLRQKLEYYAKKQNIKKIKFIGFVEEKNKAKLLAKADIAVFPSTGGESFGISLLEPMACGARVVLGGDNVGYRCILKDYPKLLVDVTDSRAFAKRLQYFLEDEKRRKAVQKWTRKTVKQYDINIVGKKIIKLYRAHL
ncbi:glycosyltransferase family 4 protein [Candidatus Saccharibacteria bacterium]|nr:glycosyltransferase family 4 protein [Candidatus Saccharibacteria bacterium]